MHSRLFASVLAASLAAVGHAQVVLVPTGAASEGIAVTSWPWGRDNSVVHVQYCYDSSHFTGQGVNAPILITRMRWRANGGVVAAGGTYSNVTVEMSTAAFDYTALTTTFANNHGADRTIVHAGSVAMAATAGTSPNTWYIDVPIAPFLYDPAAGDLLTDVRFPAGSFTGTDGDMDCFTTGSMCSRMYNLTSDTAATGTFQNNVGATLELTYTPASGLNAWFQADVTSGPTPLTVNFTDMSATSDAGGITSWDWDFDGNGTTDSTLQNPTFVYQNCGDFNPRLTVTDASHPNSTVTRTGYISTDIITASFTISLIAPPNIYQLTDTSTPPATAWAWDTDGDNVPDDFSQNPILILPPCSGADITLTATRNCRSDSVSQSVFSAANSLTTVFAQNNGLGSGAIVYSDYTVLSPVGINICAFEHNSTSTAGTAFTFDVFVTEDTFVGRELNAAAWRLAGSGTGTSAGSNNPSLGTLASPMHLPTGSYGIGIRMTGASVGYSGSTTTLPPLVVSDANLQISTGAAQSAPWSSSPLFVRRWNGTVHYGTCTDTLEAGYGFMGRGCAGTLPVGMQTVVSPPVQGSNLSLTFDNLPFDISVVMLGFSNTLASHLGGLPLPFDGTIIGATGCILRVDPEMTFFSIGAGGSQQTNLSVAIPTDPVFLCLPLYTQGLTPDPAGNPFGWVLSDAAGGVIGF